MRTTERLRAIKQWAYENLCKGREMKAPAPNGDITKIVRQEPKVYLGWSPTRADKTGLAGDCPLTVYPGILIMPGAAYAKYVEEKRFDRNNGVNRAQELGQGLSVNILFGVYEPGIRLPGFIESANHPNGLDMSRIMEGTEEGLFTLVDWMDDCISGLLAAKFIPHSDLFLDEASMIYSLYTDQSYVVDKRPLFYGFVNAKFNCYADDRNNSGIEQYLL